MSREKRARDEGKLEGQFEAAINMLNDGLPIEKISIYTGLSVEQIGSFKKTLIMNKKKRRSPIKVTAFSL